MRRRGRLAGLHAVLARQDGVAMVAAIAVLAVVLGLSAVLATVSTQLAHTSNEDRGSKRALAAAEAGLQAGTFRASKLAPKDALCVTGVAVEPELDPVTGLLECPSFTEELGNGARYTYWVTPALNVGDTCAGLPLQIDEESGLTVVQRCVTSLGEAGGAKRRVQARVAAFQGLPVFPRGGLVAKGGIEIGNASIVRGDLGANGLVKVGNASTVGDIEIAFSSPNPSVGGASNVGQVIRRTEAQGPFVLAPVDFGNSATVNDNGRISSGQDVSVKTSYDGSARTLTMQTGGALTLGGGTYNFCDVQLANNTKIMVAVGAKVRLFIDSPDRQGSGCAPGTGNFVMGQNTDILNLSGDPLNLQVYVYGSGDGTHTIEFNNSLGAHIQGAIYAPQSKLVFNNAATVLGAIAAADLQFKNSLDFTWVTSLADLRARTAAAYYRTAWKECRAEPTDPSNPLSGC